MANKENESDDLSPAEIKLLSSWIRASESQAQLDFERPDEEAIIRYLDGTATGFQERAVLEAIEVSSEFRREMLVLAKEFDRLSLPEETTAASAEPLELPDFESVVNRVQLDTHVPSSTGGREPQLDPILVGAPARTAPRQSESSDKKKAGTSRLWIPWAIAATLTIVMIGQNVVREPAHTKFIPLVEPVPAGQIEKSLFVRMNTRSAEDPVNEAQQQPSYATALEAAEEGFRDLIELKISSGQYVIHQEKFVQPSAITMLEVHLLLLDRKRSVLEETTVELPIPPDSLENAYELWMMGLPSHQTSRVTLSTDTLAFLWPDHEDSLAAFVVTRPVAGGYSVTTAQAIRVVDDLSRH